MKFYPSIETVWTRQGKSNILNVGELRNPLHGYLPSWVITEKVDGMNISVVYSGSDDFITIRGRTDRADIGNVVDAVNSNVPHWSTIRERFELGPTQQVILYGEAYGAGIGKNGKHYRNDKSFILFDIGRANTEHGTHFYLDYDNMYSIADELDIDRVPDLGTVSLSTIPTTRKQLVRLLSPSRVAARLGREYEGEGIVARPPFELLDKFGNRVIWKLCLRDLQ